MLANTFLVLFGLAAMIVGALEIHNSKNETDRLLGAVWALVGAFIIEYLALYFLIC